MENAGNTIHCIFEFGLSLIVVYTGFRGWGGGSRQAWGGTFLHGRNQRFRVFSHSKIFKKCKKINEIYNFLKIFKGIWRYFENF